MEVFQFAFISWKADLRNTHLNPERMNYRQNVNICGVGQFVCFSYGFFHATRWCFSLSCLKFNFGSLLQAEALWSVKTHQYRYAHPVFGIRDYELPTGFHQPTIFLSEPKRTENNFACRKAQCLLIINSVTVVFTQVYCLFYINYKGFYKHEMFNYWKNK